MVDMREAYDSVGGNYLNVAGWYRGTIAKVHRRKAQTKTDLQEILEVTFKCNTGPERGKQQTATFWLTEKAAWRVVMLFKYAGLKKSALPAGDVDITQVDYTPLVGCELMFKIEVETVLDADDNEKHYGRVEDFDLLTPVSAKKAEEAPVEPESEELISSGDEEVNSDLPVDDDEPPF